MNQSNSAEKGDAASRREFLKVAGTAAAAVTAASTVRTASAAPAKSARFAVAPSRVIGANDRINIGIIGVGGQGNSHLNILKRRGEVFNAQVVAVNDVYQRRLDGAHASIGSPPGKAYKNYKQLLADKDVDVVWIATPEHWHARQTLDAFAAGKDVYLEKPMSRYLDEAIALYKAVKSSGRILQVGSQGCSDAKWHTAGNLVSQGKIGTIIWSQGSYCRNNPSGEWNYPIDQDAGPQNIDWAQWLGSAKKRPYDADRYFRWRKYWDYSSGILSDLFPHRLHPLLIAMGANRANKGMAEWPLRAACTGGKYQHKDDREVADTTHMLVDFPTKGTIFVAGSTENQVGLQDMVRGHKATLYFGGNGVEIRPEQPYADEIDAETVPLIQDPQLSPNESMEAHQRNFLHCVRTRETPNCPVDLAAPVQVAVCMAEMAYLKNRQVEFDAKTLKVKA